MGIMVWVSVPNGLCSGICFLLYKMGLISALPFWGCLEGSMRQFMYRFSPSVWSWLMPAGSCY